MLESMLTVLLNHPSDAIARQDAFYRDHPAIGAAVLLIGFLGAPAAYAVVGLIGGAL